jgi:hypothetical protein
MILVVSSLKITQKKQAYMYPFERSSHDASIPRERAIEFRASIKQPF